MMSREVSSANRLIAYSSQHIIATPRHTQPNHQLPTVQFSFLSVRGRPSPRWSFTLPKLLPNNTQHLIDHLLFSPDGTLLLICTQVIQQQQQHLLRLSILTQSNSRADHWTLTWDHLLQPSQRRTIVKSCFLAEPRRWFTEPASNPSNLSDQQLINIRSTQYHSLQRTPNSSINLFAQGRGQNVILVLSTNELLVIHIPLLQLNLPPLILLTRLDSSEVAAEPLRLIPTPSQQASSNLQPASHLHPDPDPPGFLPVSSTENPPGNPPPSNDLVPIVQNHHASFSYPEIPPNQKQITMASIGLPATAGRTFDQQVDQSRILIAFQTKVTPQIPTSIFQTTVMTDSTDDHEAKTTHQDDFQFASSVGVVDDDLGEFITGLGDLDDAFDTPMLNTTIAHSEAKEFSKNKGNDNQDKSKLEPPITTNDDPNARRSLQESSDDKKSSTTDIKLHSKNHSRRFEPNLGIDDDHPSIGIPINLPSDDDDHASFGLFIRLVEVHINFEHPDLHPTVTIQPLPNLPIIDPFDYTKTTQVILRTLEFVNVTPNSNQETNPSLLRLLAGYSRESDVLPPSGGSDLSRIDWVDELQTWDLGFSHSRLSNAFLAIDCLVDHNHSTSSPPDQLLRGPPEWIFTRSANKKVTDFENDGNERTSNNTRICNVLLNWKVRNGCFILIVKSTLDPSAVATTPVATGAAENEADNPLPRKKRKIMESEVVQYQCIALNSEDLTTVAVVSLPSSLSKHEANQLCLSYHGVWCCSLDEYSRVRASPLIRSKETEVIVGLVVSAIYNRESVDDLSRFFNWAMSTTTPLPTSPAAETDSCRVPSELEHQKIFQHISSFLYHLNPVYRSYDMDPLLSSAWNVGFDLWSATPGYQNAVEVAFIARQICSVISIGTNVRTNGYAHSIWPIIGAARWYVRLCQKIVSSIDADSKSAHLSLLPTTGCTFYYLFRVAMNFLHFSHWLAALPNLQGHQDLPKVSSRNPSVSFEDELQVARIVFSDIWHHSNTINMDSWGKLLQDFGKMHFPNKGGVDMSSKPIRQIESFSIPLAAIDATQVKESVEMLAGMMSNYKQLIKSKTTPNNNNERTPILRTSPTMATTVENFVGEGEGGGRGTEAENHETEAKDPNDMSSKVDSEEERKKYDILTGGSLESDEIKLTNTVSVMKECLKCRSRTKILSCNYNDPFLSSHQHVSNDGGVSDNNNIDILSINLGQFDLSVKEFHRTCICGGPWISPSSP